MADAIEFKSSQLSLTLVRVHHSDMHEIAQLLDTKLAKASKFLRGAPVVVDPLCSLSSVQMAQLLEYLRQHQLTPVGIRTQEAHLVEYAEMCGLAVFKPSRASVDIQAPAKDPVSPTVASTAAPAETSVSTVEPTATLSERTATVHKARYIQSLRSGQCAHYLAEDVIVEGAINSGAELFVGGHVTVLGAVRGRLHAGATGDREARIIAKNFNPELVSIAGVFLLADDIPVLAKQGWVVVYLDNNSLKFSRLD